MTNTTPKVYAAIHAVLKALQVEKNGELPGNMGGKSYATAEAVSNGVKNLFVANNLILEANEELVNIDTPDFGDKKSRFLVTTRGSYKAIHIEDGSSISFSGLGQGLATGTAIATNIASTFALKNALQRQFLISEDSVEREGQTEQAAPKQNSAQQTAAASAKPPVKKATTPPPKGKERTPENAEAYARIAAKIKSKDYEGPAVTALSEKIAKELGKTKDEVMVELEKRLLAGEVA